MSVLAWLLCVLFGHALVRPPCGGAVCTRCGAATDWQAWEAARGEGGVP